MAAQRSYVLVHVLFSSAVRDETTTVKNIVDITGLRLNESLIDELKVDDEQSCCTVTVRCLTVAHATELIDCINKSKDARAFMLNSSIPVTTAETGPERREKSGHRRKSARGRDLKTLPQSRNQVPTLSSGMNLFSLTRRRQSNNPFLVSVSFDCCFSIEEALNYIQENTGFRLSQDQLELDVVDDSVTARGVFIKCDKKSSADKLILEFNRSLKGSPTVAVMLDLSLDSLHHATVSVVWNELHFKALERIAAHKKKSKEAYAKFSEECAAVESVKRGKKWLPIDEYERKKAITKPLKDKVEELLLQQNEFDSQLVALRSSFEAINVGSKRKSDLIRIKIEFERELDRFNVALPMYARKSQITRAICKNQVCIVLGETGSGKSTQILQYLHGAGLADHGTIVCTQPRKVAAISLARRVSEEMRCKVGQLVGYRVGMQAEQKIGVTRLLYVTDHVLLNDCLKDPLFKAYSCIVIDEAHERSIYSDLLLGFVKRALPLRSDLRVVIMSATIDPVLFVSYFSNCCVGQAQSSTPVLRISGRAYPVDVVYQGIAVEDYVTEAVVKALELHRGEPPGDVLVFLTSPIETEQACKKLNELLKNSRDVILLELHGRLQIEDQQKIFEPTPEGMRKIVFATNSAETSITIPGIKYVVDTGKVREVNYDPKRNVSELAVQWVTRSSAEQRKGRAGRTDCGKCIRLYSEEQYKEMRPDSVPEILRVHLGQALLKLMMLGIVDATKFDFVQAPDTDAIISAQAVLRELKACDDDGITETGKKLTKLSLEPRLGKVALRGIDEGIPFESIVMAAVSTVGGSIFFRAGSDEQKCLADRKKTRFCDEWGDIVTLVNVYKEWDSLPTKDLNRWCKENSINARSMRTAKSTVNEIELTFKHELNIAIPHRFCNNVAANEKMAKIIFECFPSNLSRYCGHRQEGYCVASSPDMVLHVHPSSALNYAEDWPQWVVHEKIMTTSRTFMLNATFVKDSWVEEKMLTSSAGLLREKIVEPHPTIYVGRRFISRLLKKEDGRVQLKKELEFVMRSKGPDAKAVIDVVTAPDCCGGSITVHSTPFVRRSAADLMAYELSNTSATVMNEVVEEPLFPNSSVRIVVERGAQIRTIIMPNESRQVKISRLRVDGDPNAVVMMALSQFGDVESVEMDDQSGDVLGRVVFKYPEHASAAVESLKNNSMRAFDVELFIKAVKQERSPQNSDFMVRVIAQRRPLKGFGYISFADPATALAVALMGGFMIIGKTNSAMVPIQQDKKRTQQCYMKTVPVWADDKIIKTSLLAAIGYDIFIQNVTLPRVPPPSQAESNQLLIAFQTHITTTLLGTHKFTAEDFTMNVKEPKNDKDFDMRAFLKFSDPNKARRATKILSKSMFQLCPLDATLDLKVSLVIPKYIHNSVKPYIESEIEKLQSEAVEKLSIEIQERPQFKLMVFNIMTSCLSDLILAKCKLSVLIKGHSVQLNRHQISHLKSTAGRKLLEKFPLEMQTTVVLDLRSSVAVIYGSQDKVLKTERRLVDELRSVAGQLKKSVALGCTSYPKGMMKAVLVGYGPDLEKLKDSCGAASLDLDIRRRQLEFAGSAEAHDALVKLLDKIAADLPGEKGNANRDRLPDCPVCLTDVEKDSYYVMEYCRHVYCKNCVDSLFDNAIRSNDIPIRCAADGCGLDVVIQDLRNVRDRNLRPLYEAALRSFMPRRTNEYRNCVTPNCPMIYRRTADDKEGRVFNCSECHTSLCTSCNVAYHVGLTCAFYRRFKDDDVGLKLWLKEDQKERSICPKCGVGIEKDGGCSHVECTVCKVHICWICKATFSTNGECYSHINTCGVTR